MRIRKRYQNPLLPPDLPSPLPPSVTSAAAAVAPPVGATGGREGEAVTAAAAGRASGGGCGGGGGRGLHANGRSTNPTTCLPFLTPPTAPAAPGRGEERGDLAPPGPRLPTRDAGFDHRHGREMSHMSRSDPLLPHQVPKREPEGENGRDTGDAHSGDNAPVPKSLGAEASEVSEGHNGHTMLPSGAAAVVLAAADAVGIWSDEEGDFSLKKRRGGFYARGRSFGQLLEAKEDDDEENIVPEREMEQRRPSRTRRRRYTAASSSTTMAASGTVLTSAGNASNGGAPSASGDGASVTKKCDYMVVKEEGGDVMPAAAAALVDGNRGSGNGKKRRSPAVLMEGSRCSRVNGRGWRCCQQTLVGYSLCEHHLGKGRLRSVSSVRWNGRARKEDVGDHGAAAPPLPSLLRQQDQLLSGNGEDEEEEKKPGKRRRNKIGMVKARSISSLLHQPDHPPTPTVAIAAPPEPFPCPSPIPATRPVTAAAPPSYGSDTAVA